MRHSTYMGAITLVAASAVLGGCASNTQPAAVTY